ncbi:MAG: Asp-tRNA(Asn)/Glu-tRNA(Gln) amidotransferase subunit GatA, partial [Nitrospina sp.]|nr:Asp-tRNA(Asn)/Glu-tRNA(Gln) amidotransferase subunit GatA [Nitrospina sp.]
AGIPGMSIPCGFAEGLPVGLQLMAKHFDEASLITTGHKFQQNTDFHTKEVPL